MSKLFSDFAKYCAAVVLIAVAMSATAQARGTGHSINGARYYGPVYGWRYNPPPAATPVAVCNWSPVRVMRNGQMATRRVRHCS